MPFTNLSDHLLHAQGILNKLKTIQSELRHVPPDLAAISSQKKLLAIKNNLRSIFFENLDEQGIQQALTSRFSQYPDLQNVLRTVFSETTMILDDKIVSIEASLSNAQDSMPDSVVVMSHFQRLNKAHEYFKFVEKAEPLTALYTKLVEACRKVVLIEQSNLADDKIAYEYAYTLMALLIDEQKPLPSFEALSKKISKFMAPTDTLWTANAKPFRDVLQDLKLPVKPHDMAGWVALNHKEGRKALQFFVKATSIEDQNVSHMAPIDLGEARALSALCKYPRAAEDEAFARLCFDYDVSISTFDMALDYIGQPPIWPKKLTDTIPDITIESPEGEYVWTKCSAQDKRGLILGQITHCCISIGGKAGQCAQDATSLNDNGFYFLLKRKKSSQPYKTGEGLINDQAFQIVGQSYVWKSKTGNLCLDSVEFLAGSIKPEQLHPLMSDFAEQVLKHDPSIKRVTLGVGGKTPERLFPRITPLPENIRQGYFYGDASTQYLVAQGPSPFSEVEQQSLTKFFRDYPEFCACIEYLCDYLADTQDLAERIKAMVIKNPSIATVFKRDKLFCLLRFTQSPTLDDLLPVDWDALTPQLSTGRLIWQADTFEKKMKCLPYLVFHGDKDYLVWLKEPDRQGKTVLDHAAANPKFLTDILERLPPSIRLAVLQDNNTSTRSSPQITLESDFDVVAFIVDLFPQSDWIEALRTCTINQNPFFEVIAANPPFLRELLQRLPETQRLDVTSFGLFGAAEHPESLQMLLALYRDPEDRFEEIKRTEKGMTLLHAAAKSSQSLKILLALYPDDSERRAALQETSISLGDLSVLSYVASVSSESLQTLLEPYSVQERLVIIKDSSRKRCMSVFQAAASNPESLKIIMALYPESELLLEVEKTCAQRSQKNALHFAAMSSTESLRMLLALYPPSQLFAAIKKEDRARCHVLFYASKNPESFRLICEQLPAADLLALFHENSKIFSNYKGCFEIYKNILLHQAAALTYTQEIVTDIRSATDYSQLEKILNKASQAKMKAEIAVRSDDSSDLSKRSGDHPDSYHRS